MWLIKETSVVSVSVVDAVHVCTGKMCKKPRAFPNTQHSNAAVLYPLQISILTVSFYHKSGQRSCRAGWCDDFAVFLSLPWPCVAYRSI